MEGLRAAPTMQDFPSGSDVGSKVAGKGRRQRAYAAL
jgi:hypothetical protein